MTFPELVAAQAPALAFAGLGLFALATVLFGQPWTAEFSRADYPAQAADPIFVSINRIVSAIWGALFLPLALGFALKPQPPSRSPSSLSAWSPRSSAPNGWSDRP